MDNSNETLKYKLLALVEEVKTIENAMATLVRDDRELQARHTMHADELVEILKGAEAKEVALMLYMLVQRARQAARRPVPAVAVKCPHSSGWSKCYPRVVEPEQLYPDMDTTALDQEHAQHQQELHDLMQNASQKDTELAEMSRRKKDLSTACREKQGQLKKVCKLKVKLLKELRGMSPKKQRPQRPQETEEERVARMERETFARIAEQKKAELAAYAEPDSELSDLMAIFGQSPHVSTAALRSLSPQPARARPVPPAVQDDYRDSMASPIELSPAQPDHHNVTSPVARTIGPARARIRARNAKMSRQQSSVPGNGHQRTLPLHEAEALHAAATEGAEKLTKELAAEQAAKAAEQLEVVRAEEEELGSQLTALGAN